MDGGLDQEHVVVIESPHRPLLKLAPARVQLLVVRFRTRWERAKPCPNIGCEKRIHVANPGPLHPRPRRRKAVKPSNTDRRPKGR